VRRCCTLLTLFVALVGVACSRPGIELTLTNVGDVTLDSVVVHTTGFTYPIGALSPSASRTLLVNATGESHVEVEHGPASARRRLVLDVYFERNYRGSIDARLRSDTVLSVTHERW
jgi:hypothetical protein